MTDKPINTYRLDESFYKKLEEFTQKFLTEGFDLFAPEFANIEPFLARARCDCRPRDDHQFRRTPREFYLLEALYYRIFDEAFREEFNRAEHTVIILPQCLAIRGDKCKRKKGKHGSVCTHCAKDCQIHEIMKTAEKYGVEGYFSKRSLVKQLQGIKKRKKSLSVIGISCILTLTSGMRSAREAEIPARGVLLNLTGCEHWCDNPFPTETVVSRVKAILEEKYGLSDKADNLG